jgi:hypothetical protein
MPNTLLLEEIHQLRKMTRQQAETFLRKFSLSSEEYNDLLPLIGRDLPASATQRTLDYDPLVKLWYATVFLLGASYNTIARSAGCSSQNIQQIICRVLRNRSLRLGARMSLEAYSEYRQAYYDNIARMDKLKPQECAEWLKENITLDKNTDD